MNEKNKTDFRNIIILLVVGVVLSALMGLAVRPLVPKAAASPVATVSDATPTDPTVDSSPNADK